MIVDFVCKVLELNTSMVFSLLLRSGLLTVRLKGRDKLIQRCICMCVRENIERYVTLRLGLRDTIPLLRNSRYHKVIKAFIRSLEG